MRFAIVVAAILAVASAAPQSDATDGGFGDAVAQAVTISLDAVRKGAAFTLDTLLRGGIVGLDDVSINGVKGVALTDDESLVGILTKTDAVLLSTIPETMNSINISESVYKTLRHVLCFTDNWSHQLDLIHKHATMAHGDIQCDSGVVTTPIADKLINTADGVLVNRDYYNFVTCCVRQQLTTARTIYNFLITKLAAFDKDCHSYYVTAPIST